ncbi:MAG: DNA/RNA non-specific endonuclease [Pyrinomonadaceae bacterium]
MKKIGISIFAFFCVVAACFVSFRTSAQKAELVSPHLVISQFQAGGASNANDEFIEIHNTSDSPVDLNGYRLVYRSQNGQSDVAIPFAVWNTSTIVQPGGFHLVASTSYDGAVTPNTTYNNTACSCAMAAAQGGLAIRFGANDTGAIIDSVGWGTITNGFNEGTTTTAPGNDNSKARIQNGCQDTDSNSADFATLTPSAPRNASTTPAQCSGSGANLFATMNANPTTVSPNGNTLLTVTVIPATTPPSTFITVAANLQSIGGASSQPFFDNGTNGDVTAGDNVFSFLATVASGTPGGIAPIVGAAVDFQTRVATVQVVLTINAPLPDEDPLIFGNPSNATADIANENNYLMIKPQYSLSYNRSRAIPNWTAWRLDSSWIGSAPRQDDFRPDMTLPAGWYQVLDSDYSGSGYDRGHMCPSGDRTRSIPDNSATFLMTNIIPQFGPNNQGPWNDLENYLRTLANQGNELYIFSGGFGNFGTIANGQIVVPDVTWKVVMVLPNGTNDLSRVTRGTRVFGVIMPNHAPLTIGQPWRTYRVTVNAVERLTGYDFFTNIPKGTQEIMERRHDIL